MNFVKAMEICEAIFYYYLYKHEFISLNVELLNLN